MQIHKNILTLSGRNTEAKKLINEVGAPVAENEHSLTAGPRGSVMMQTFECTEDISARLGSRASGRSFAIICSKRSAFNGSM